MSSGQSPARSLISLGDWNQGRTVISNLRFGGGHLYWLELRFEEGGRQVLMRSTLDGCPEEVLGPEVSVSSTVYEYGGGSFAVSDRGVFVVDAVSGQLLHRPVDGGDLCSLPDAEVPAGYGDLDTRGHLLVAVRETPGGLEPSHSVVLVDLERRTLTALASGRDFYAAPRLAADLDRVCFLCWDHPNMPWDAAELYEIDLLTGKTSRLAGGEHQSITQPRYTQAGDLAYLDDASGYWNLRIRTGDGVFVHPPLANAREMSGFGSRPGSRVSVTLSDTRLGRFGCGWVVFGVACPRRVEAPGTRSGD